MPEAILLKDVEELGDRGAVIDVSKGYLRNYLIPRKLAQPATKGAIETVRQRQAAEERAAREAVEKAQENVNLLNRTVLTIPQQAGADGRLFGSVTAQDIASAIREARGLRIDKRGRAPPRADQERRHLHGRRGRRRRRAGHGQDHGRRQEIEATRPAIPPGLGGRVGRPTGSVSTAAPAAVTSCAGANMRSCPRRAIFRPAFAETALGPLTAATLNSPDG